MDIKQLEAFVVLCDELHFTRAAERLGIAQPTLSLQIRALEDSIGLPLFDRTGKRITLTQAGDVLLRRAKQVLQTLKNAQEELNDLRHLHVGRLVIGMLGGDLDFRITNILIEFHREFPNIQLSLHGPMDIRQMILQNEVDIGLSVISHEDSRLVQIPLIHETFGVLVNVHHELATCDCVSIKELGQWPLIMFPKGYAGRELLEGYCLEQGIEMEPIIETSTVPSIVNLVRHGIGITVLSKQLVASIDSAELKFVKLVNPTPSRDIGIIYRSDRYLSHAARSFIRKISDYLKYLDT